MTLRNKLGFRLAEFEPGITDLNGMDLREADFANLSVEGGSLSDADLRNADFSGADLYWTYMFRANCEGCDFSGARLSGVNLEETNLRNTNLRRAYVSYDNLGGGSSVKGANLTESILEDTILQGCRYNAETRFPDGFNPEKAGMVLEAD